MVLLVKVETGMTPVVRRCHSAEEAWDVINREIRDEADYYLYNEEEFDEYATFEETYAMLDGYHLNEQIEWHIIDEQQIEYADGLTEVLK